MKDKILFTLKCEIDQIKCKLRKRSNRAISYKIESQIDNIWASCVAEKKQDGHVLYNGNTFRVEEIENKNTKIKMFIYPSNYKVFFGLYKQMDKISRLGKKYSPNNLAVGALLKTKDHKYVFCRQSKKAYKNPKISIIGGVVEKTKTLKNVLKANLLKEIMEETGITENKIASIKPLSFIQSKHGSIILFNLVELKITSHEVLKIFKTKHDKEVSELILVLKEKITNFVTEMGYLSLIRRLINRI